MPVVPLDGGRAMAAMAPWMWFVGLGGMVVLVFVFPNPIILLIILSAASRPAGAGSRASAGERGQRRLLPRHAAQPAAVGAVYVGLIALLASGWT